MQLKNSPFITVLLVISAFLIGSMWTKIQYLEGKPNTSAPIVNNGTGVNPTAAPVNDSPLSIVSMKAYAKELGLDVNKFNTCLDQKKYDKVVIDDTSYGQGIGVNGTPAFFINGKFLSGAQPLEVFKEIIDKELDGTGSESIDSYSENLQRLAKVPPEQGGPVFIPGKREVKISQNDPVRGTKDAKVTIVDFSDFECPFCARVFPTIKTLEQTYKEKIRVVYKQYPLPFHPNANPAANASLCANEQGKFWEYHDKLFTVQQG